MSFGQIREINLYAVQEPLYRDVRGFKIYSVNEENCDIEFEIKSEGGSFTNACLIKIYGVSRETFKDLSSNLERNKRLPVEVTAGYLTDRFYSVIFSGNVMMMQYEFNNGDPYVQLILDNNNEALYEKHIEKTYAENTTREFIIKDIIRESGYIEKFVFVPPELNTIYRRGYTAVGSPKEILDKIASDIYMSYTFDNMFVSVTSRWHNELNEVIPLDFESGLITYPKEGENKVFNFTTFLNHKIKTDTIILIVTDEFGRVLPIGSSGEKNYYKVTKYSHIAGDINTFETSVECEVTDVDLVRAKFIWEHYYKGGY